MTINEFKLAAHFLNIASDVFSCHGCNDVPEKLYDGWTIEERRQFVKEYYDWCDEPEEYDENNLHIGDDALMCYLAYKLTY